MREYLAMVSGDGSCDVSIMFLVLMVMMMMMFCVVCLLANRLSCRLRVRLRLSPRRLLYPQGDPMRRRLRFS